MLQLLGRLSPNGIRLLAEMRRLQTGINRAPVDALRQHLQSNQVQLKNLPGAVRMMEEKIHRHGLDRLVEGMAWVKANRPDESCSPCLCHGDLHPGNIMPRIVAILDWANAVIADKEWDVAKPLLVLQAGPFMLISKPVDALVSLGKGLDGATMSAEVGIVW